MAGRLENSWTLVKASANVLALDKELLVFPLMSGVASVLVTISFFAPLALTGGLEIFAEDGGSYLGYVLGFLFYLVQYTVVFFFNSALVGAALLRMEGEDPTVSDGFGIAMRRIGVILEYAALAATVGMVFRFLSERSGPLGRIVVGLVGMGWNLATFLAVPVLVTRNMGPIDTVRESAELFRRTWGEQVVGNFGMGLAFFMMGLSWAVVSVALILGAGNLFPAALIPAIGIAVLGFIGLGLVSSALKGIYAAALFRHASGGEGGLFDRRMMDQAFRPK
jgi:hypothetical protein